MRFKEMRKKTAGFTLFEAVLTMAGLSIMLVGIYIFLFKAFERQLAAQQDYELASMARAILDEYVATYPNMPRTGIYREAWAWEVSEAEVQPLQPSELNKYFRFIEVTSHVWPADQPDAGDRTMSTVMARRGDGT